MPRKKTARMVTIQASVIAALREAGALKAPTPLEIASVPVMATHPSAKARSMRNVNAKPVGCRPRSRARAWGARGATEMCVSPSMSRAMPVPISASITAMNTYVGRLNAAPDSRTPRRFTSIRTMIAQAQRGTVVLARTGYADVIAATPLEIETATVRM